MLVNELRNTIKNYNSDEKDKIIVELYKKISKKLKEEYDIDNYILNIKNESKTKKVIKEIEPEKLFKEANYFFDCVNSDLYCTPNRIISKNERSKWRSKVKYFFKNLNSLSPQTDNGKKATYLLCELYNILSKGTTYLKFPSFKTFSSINMSQDDLYELLITRILVNGLTLENIDYCIKLLINYNIYFEDLLFTLINKLTTIDTKYSAIKCFEDKLSYLKDRIEIVKRDSMLTYHYTNLYNNFVYSISYIYITLSEVNNAINNFKKNYMNNKKTMYQDLLSLLYDTECYNEYIKVFESINIDIYEGYNTKYEEIKNKLKS